MATVFGCSEEKWLSICTKSTSLLPCITFPQSGNLSLTTLPSTSSLAWYNIWNFTKGLLALIDLKSLQRRFLASFISLGRSYAMLKGVFFNIKALFIIISVSMKSLKLTITGLHGSLIPIFLGPNRCALARFIRSESRSKLCWMKSRIIWKQFSPGFTKIPQNIRLLLLDLRERSGSVVECLTRDRRAAGLSLTGVTALWSLSKTHLS